MVAEAACSSVIWRAADCLYGGTGWWSGRLDRRCDKDLVGVACQGDPSAYAMLQVHPLFLSRTIFSIRLARANHHGGMRCRGNGVTSLLEDSAWAKAHPTTSHFTKYASVVLAVSHPFRPVVRSYAAGFGPGAGAVEVGPPFERPDFLETNAADGPVEEHRIGLTAVPVHDE